MSLRSFLHIGETDCVAGVVGLELPNPLGLKSVLTVGIIFDDLAKTAKRRPFAFELRGGGYAAAGRDFGRC
jgi:hypothetical protein